MPDPAGKPGSSVIVVIGGRTVTVRRILVYQCEKPPHEGEDRATLPIRKDVPGEHWQE
jgi:hypothetical protein